MAGFCDSGQSSQNKNQWVDPLGPSSINPKSGKATYGATGAVPLRTSVFDYLGAQTPQIVQAGQNAATAAQSAASNPAWASAQNLAQKTINGDYLGGSPQLSAAMDQNRVQQMRAAADQNARTNSNYATNGMNFSTAHDQAAQANSAAAASSAANTNAQTYLQNYLQQAGYQQNGVNNLSTATGTPLSYLSSVSSAQTAPLNQIGNIISGLSSGGQVSNIGQTGVSSPSLGSNIMNGASVLGNF